MRLAGVSNIEQANTFLQEYLPKYRSMFVVPPANPKNLHRPIPSELDLDWVFAFREKRVIANDFTISWRNRTFLLTRPSGGLKKERVTVLENLKGEIRIWGNKRFLEFQEITRDTLRQMRQRETAQKALSRRVIRKPWRPPADHPWRRQNRAIFAQLYAALGK
jgi:hypothetical protein